MLALAAVRFRRTARAASSSGAGAAIYFVSRADLEHAQGLLVIAAAAAAFVRPRLVGRRAPRRCCSLVGDGQPGQSRCCARRTSRRTRACACRRREAQALPRMVAAVQQLVPPGEPIYVAPLRSDLVTFSNPLIHYLADRPNVLRRDVLLQAKPEEQERIVAALERAQAEGDRPLDRARVRDAASPTAAAARAARARSTSTSQRAYVVDGDASATTRCCRPSSAASSSIAAP